MCSLFVNHKGLEKLKISQYQKANLQTLTKFTIFKTMVNPC